MGEEVNATVMLGRLLELRCQSDAIPPPTLSWRKDGRPLFRKPGLTVSEDGSVLKVQSNFYPSLSFSLALALTLSRSLCHSLSHSLAFSRALSLSIYIEPYSLHTSLPLHASH